MIEARPPELNTDHRARRRRDDDVAAAELTFRLSYALARILHALGLIILSKTDAGICRPRASSKK